MKNIWVIGKREFVSYFTSPIAYIAITAFLVLVGFCVFYVESFLDVGQADTVAFLKWVPLLFIFFIPAVTMRLVSEEKRTGSIELLITMPIRDIELVLGKLLGAFLFLLLTLALTVFYPVCIDMLGPLDWGATLGAYLGLALLGLAFLSIGVWTSCRTRNQIVAFIVALLFCSVLYFIDFMIGGVWGTEGEVLSYLSFKAHFETLAKGVIDTRSLVFYSSVVILMVAQSTLTLGERRWSKPHEGAKLRRFALLWPPTLLKYLFKDKHRLNAIALSVCVIASLVVVDVLSFRNSSRWDLTEGQFHSLDEYSEEVVKSMPGLQVTVYLSETYPKKLRGPRGRPVENVSRYIRGLLEKINQYAEHAGKSLDLRIVRKSAEEMGPIAAANKFIAFKAADKSLATASDKDTGANYYIAIRLEYRRSYHDIPAIAVRLTDFESLLTGAMSRLREKVEASQVMRKLLRIGKDMNEAVGDCIKVIQNQKQSGDESEGGLFSKQQQNLEKRVDQVSVYLRQLSTIDAACGKVATLVGEAKAEANQRQGKTRSLSDDQFNALIQQIGQFDGFYASWVASLINASRSPEHVGRLDALMKHPQVSARRAALQVYDAILTDLKSLNDLRAARATGELQPLQQQRLQMLAKQESALTQLAVKALQAAKDASDDPDPVVHGLALRMRVVAGGADATAAILGALAKDDAFQRETGLHLAREGRIEVPMERVKSLLDSAQEKSPNVRRAAVALWASQKGELSALRPLLADSDQLVQAQTAMVLAQLGDVQSLPTLEKILLTLPPRNQTRLMLQIFISELKKKAPKATGTEGPSKAKPGLDAKAAPEKLDAIPRGKAVRPPGSRQPRAPRAGRPAPPKGGGGLSLGGNSVVDRVGEMKLPDPVKGAEIMGQLGTQINKQYESLVESPGRKSIGFLCGHEEFCPFEDTSFQFEKLLGQFGQNKPFAKMGLQQFKALEGKLNQENEAIRRHFMTQGYRLVRVEAGQPVDESVAALFIYGPRRALRDSDLYHVDQFILSGRPTIVFLNNYEVMVNQWSEKKPYNLVTRLMPTGLPQGGDDQYTWGGLDALLNHYGVRNNRDLVMEPKRANQAKINTIEMAQTQVRGLMVASGASYSYPLFPKFKSFGKNTALVSHRKELVLPFVSSLSPNDPGSRGLRFHRLVTSTDSAVAWGKRYLKSIKPGEVGRVLSPRRLRNEIETAPASGPHTVVAQVTGEAIGAFTAGRKAPEAAKNDKEKEGGKADKPEAPKRERQIRGRVNLLVVGSNMGFEGLHPSRVFAGFNVSQLLTKKLAGIDAIIPYVIRWRNVWGRLNDPFNPDMSQAPYHRRDVQMVNKLPGQQSAFWINNLKFMQDVFQWASGSEGMIGLKNKRAAYTDREFENTSASTHTRIKWGLIAGLPVGFLFCGMGIFVIRRTRRRKWQPKARDSSEVTA